MAARLNIMGLPTLLFLDKYEPKDDEEVQEGAKAGTFSFFRRPFERDLVVEKKDKTMYARHDERVFHFVSLFFFFFSSSPSSSPSSLSTKLQS